MRLIKELIHRRIPHIIGSYLIAGTSLILFVDWLVNRYTLPEYYIDQNPESIYYKNYYNAKGPSEEFVGLSNFTKDELNSLLNKTHPFYEYEGQANMRYGFPVPVNIKIKIDEIYDSTATASIYKTEDPNIKLRVGDIVKY